MMSQALLVISLLLVFNSQSYAEVEMPTTSYNRDTEKQEARTSTSRSKHPLSFLPLASLSERNHALFFGTTKQTPSEASRGMILESHCSASHIQVGDKTLIVSSYHCLSESSYFYPYFLGFEGVWIFSNIDYAVAAVQMKFEVTDPNYDIALFYETKSEMKNSRYFKPVVLADRLPELYQTVTFIGYPGGVGPAKVTCTYYGLAHTTVDDNPKHIVPGKLYCPSTKGLSIAGASGSAVLNQQGKVIGVLRSAGEPFVFFTPFTTSTLKVKDGNASLDFSAFQGKLKTQLINDTGDQFECKLNINRSGHPDGKAECKHVASGDKETAVFRDGVLTRAWSY